MLKTKSTVEGYIVYALYGMTLKISKISLKTRMVPIRVGVIHSFDLKLLLHSCIPHTNLNDKVLQIKKSKDCVCLNLFCR